MLTGPAWGAVAAELNKDWVYNVRQNQEIVRDKRQSSTHSACNVWSGVKR